MSGLLLGLLDLLLPPLCAACGAALGSGPDRSAHDPASAGLERVLCRGCRLELSLLSPAACNRCQEGRVPAAREGVARPHLCSGCRGRRGPLARCVAAAAYEGAALAWIQEFKYPAPGLAGLRPGPEAIVGALVESAALRIDGPLPDLVIPIPLHPTRLRARRFNPAAGLARQLVARLALGRPRAARPRIAADRLVRVRDTPSQTTLSRAQRRTNVRGAFACPSPERLAPHVWLVDDVVTTGSTLAEAARTLRRAGVERIDAVCAARTLPRRA